MSRGGLPELSFFLCCLSQLRYAALQPGERFFDERWFKLLEEGCQDLIYWLEDRPHQEAALRLGLSNALRLSDEALGRYLEEERIPFTHAPIEDFRRFLQLLWDRALAGRSYQDPEEDPGEG